MRPAAVLICRSPPNPRRERPHGNHLFIQPSTLGAERRPLHRHGVTSGDWYRPAVDVNAQVQLQGTPNISYDVELYVLDLFDTDSAVIDALHADGRKMICYFSAGTFENWRDDAGRFTAADKGRRLGNWPGER